MEGMEDKLSSILGNPDLMQQIMTMAQSLGGGQEPPPEAPKPAPALPELDMGTIQKLTGLMGQTNIDRNQQALLRALMPYLSGARIQKLENAMRAAKMAGFAAVMLRQQGGLFSPGR